MKCEHCGYETEGMEYLPYCPFCRQSYPCTEEEENALRQAKAALAGRDARTALTALTKAVSLGSVPGHYLYGKLLENGNGTRKDPAKALAAYTFAAKRGYAAAAAALGRILLRDYGSDRENTALFWYLLAAEEGDGDAAYELATAFSSEDTMYYLTAAALYGNPKAAMAAARALDEKKDPDKSRIRGFLALAGKEAAASPVLFARYLMTTPKKPELPSRDEKEIWYRIGDMAAAEKEDFIALSCFARAAGMGHSLSAVRIGNFFATGRFVKKSLPIAGKWYLQAADAGDTNAMVSLGEMFLYGNGIEKDVKKALALFCRCASLGDAKAQFMAAELYFNHPEIRRDLPLALSLYEKSANQNYPPALEKRADIFRAVTDIYNQGIAAWKAENYETAVRKFTLAAEMNHGGALCNLGYCYQKGLGCSRDMKKALALYRRAILAGKSSARYNLGLCYLRNDGVRFDAARAEELLLGSGDPGAEALVAEMKARKRKKTAASLYSTGCSVYRKGAYMEALRYFTLAAAGGCQKAAVMIGCYYEFGSGIPRNIETARRYYQKSGLSMQAIDRLKRGFLRSTIASSDPKRQKTAGV